MAFSGCQILTPLQTGNSQVNAFACPLLCHRQHARRAQSLAALCTHLATQPCLQFDTSTLKMPHEQSEATLGYLLDVLEHGFSGKLENSTACSICAG